MKRFKGFRGDSYRNKTTPLTDRQMRVCQMKVLGLQNHKQIAAALNYKQVQVISAIVNSPSGKAYIEKLRQEIQERFLALAMAKSMEAHEVKLAKLHSRR